MYSDDGRLRRSTYVDLSSTGDNRYTEVSDVPLQGEIVNLHLVENERTKEELIVGGADDGSIALWDMKYVHSRPVDVRC